MRKKSKCDKSVSAAERVDKQNELFNGLRSQLDRVGCNYCEGGATRQEVEEFVAVLNDLQDIVCISRTMESTKRKSLEDLTKMLLEAAETASAASQCYKDITKRAPLNDLNKAASLLRGTAISACFALAGMDRDSGKMPDFIPF